MKKKAFTLFLSVLLLLSILTGCGAQSSSAVYGGVVKNEMAMGSDMAAEEPMASAEAMEDGALTEESSSNPDVPPQNRKWIITVNLRAETEDLDEVLKNLQEQITQLNGYVEDQNIYNGSNYSSRRYRSASMTVRIPAEDVDAFTANVAGFANVVSNSKSLEDITLRYSDTENRLAALKTEQTRLLELLEKAENMADLLEIEARLTDVQYELERVGSRLKTYDNKIDYATIYLDLDEVQEYTPTEEPTFFERIGTGFKNSLKGLWQSLQNLLVFLIVSLPYILVYGGIIAMIVWLIRKACKARKTKKEAKKAEKTTE